ncbi:hypothetical protein HRbin27_01115 [bacterium HR27]|nr:hypothetical protein HRbin27_01115 [bacterium HR27]
MADVQEVENGQVFPGLGHRPLVGRHDQKSRVEPADAGEHVLDESLVTGDVDDTQPPTTRQGHPGEAEVDGHLALFFFPQPIGIDAGECFHQRRLPVVDVTGGTDDVGLAAHR